MWLFANVTRFARSCGYTVLCVLWQKLFIPLFKVLWRVVFNLVGRVVMPFSVFCGKRYLFLYLKSCGKCLLDLLNLVVMLFSVFCGKRYLFTYLKSCGECYSICSILWLCCSLCFVANAVPLSLMASVIRFAQSCCYVILSALWQTLFIPLFKVLWRVVFSLVGRVVMLYSVFCGCVISLWESCGKCYSLFSCLAVISFLCLVIISFCKSCGQRLADYALLCVELHFSSFVGCC